MLDSSDPIHEACDFLVPESEYELLRIVSVNEMLRNREFKELAWPRFLVAFASNGCGDYFAYDLRGSPDRIIYIDPDLTIDENLIAVDKLTFPSFETWYHYKVSRHSGTKLERR